MKSPILKFSTPYLFLVIFLLIFSCAQNRKEDAKEQMQILADREDAYQAIEALTNLHHSDSLAFETKSFCDDEQFWQYQVTVEKTKVIIEVFPGAKNTNQKDKSKASETINSYIVKDNVIATKNNNGEWRQLYWYNQNKLFQYGAEDSIEEMAECSQ